MITEKGFYRKVQNTSGVGPGGFKCRCCAPASKKQFRREARKRVDRVVYRDIERGFFSELLS